MRWAPGWPTTRIHDDTNGAIGSLATDGTNIYATGWAFGAGASFEGAFVADPADGRIIWLDDCLGDNYSTTPIGDAVYTVGHPHDCTMINGFPDTNPRVRWQHSLAFTKAATGRQQGPGRLRLELRRSAGAHAAPLVPDWSTGSVTGQYQAGWSITGNSSYVVVAGEFPYVNNGAQQGLVRFGIGAAADNSMAPTYNTNPARPTPSTTAGAVRAGTVRVAFGSAWDKDNETLSYQVVRDGNDQRRPAAPVEVQLLDPSRTRGHRHQRARRATTPTRCDVTDPAGNTHLQPDLELRGRLQLERRLRRRRLR